MGNGSGGMGLWVPGRGSWVVGRPARPGRCRRWSRRHQAGRAERPHVRVRLSNTNPANDNRLTGRAGCANDRIAMSLTAARTTCSSDMMPPAAPPRAAALTASLRNIDVSPLAYLTNESTHPAAAWLRPAALWLRPRSALCPGCTSLCNRTCATSSESRTMPRT